MTRKQQSSSSGMGIDQSPLVVITSLKGAGCTFLDWSLLYLSGQDQHFSLEHDDWVPICDDPLDTTNGNAHQHQKNHPLGRQQTADAVARLSQHQQGIRTVYPAVLSDYTDLDTWLQEYQALLGDCLDQELPLIFVECDARAIGYFWNLRGYSRSRDSFDQLFFPDSRQAWQDLGLTDVWDQRERMALDMRPFNLSMFPKIAFDRAYHHVNCQDLWHATGDVMHECFDFLQLAMDQHRWTHWQQVAGRWQHIQQLNLRFYHNLPHMVEAIVHGWYLKLPEMPLWQESVIQHCLIYQHGLNLRTWQLSRFPDNAQKLHALLESNTHPLSP